MSNKSMGERICDNKINTVKFENKKSQKQKDKEIQKKLKELKNNRVQTIILLIVLLMVIMFFVITLVKVSNKPKIVLDDTTILTTLNINEYSLEIVAMYNREGQLELFKNEMDRIQNIIGKYIIENMTISDEAQKELIKGINKELKKDTWKEILNNKSTYYVGDYSVDENGNLKFKFKIKEIEPTWINDASISKYIILN